MGTEEAGPGMAGRVDRGSQLEEDLEAEGAATGRRRWGRRERREINSADVAGVGGTTRAKGNAGGGLDAPTDLAGVGAAVDADVMAQERACADCIC